MENLSAQRKYLTISCFFHPPSAFYKLTGWKRVSCRLPFMPWSVLSSSQAKALKKTFSHINPVKQAYALIFINVKYLAHGAAQWCFLIERKVLVIHLSCHPIFQHLKQASTSQILRLVHIHKGRRDGSDHIDFYRF